MDNNFVKVGKWGECLWGINENGELYVNEGLAESIENTGSPWADSADVITSATVMDTVTFPEGASLSGLFKGCKILEKADLSGFVTDNVVDMSSMFEGCANLRELDISSFDTRRCVNMNRMFSQCAKLTEILLGQNFSTNGDGTTDAGKLAIKEYGKYRKAKTLSVEGFKVYYHSNLGDDRVEEKQTVPNYRYMIEDPMYDAPSEKAAFVAWNTQPDAKGNFYSPGRALDNVDENLDLYAIWAYAPEIKEVTQPPSFMFGEPIPFELPEIVSVNDPNVSGFLEISKTGEEGSWHAIDRNTILPVSFDGYYIRLHASNSVGETVSNPVKLSIRRANIDMSGVRWADDGHMVYDGKPKTVYVEGLPSGIEARYEGNTATDAGTYVASFNFDFDQANFNDPLVIREHEWTIHKATLDMSAVRWDYSGAFSYDGKTHGVELVGLPEGVSATYANNTASNAGVYSATATLEYDSKNYEKPAEIMPCIWEIKKVAIDPKTLEWTAYDEFVYDGTPKTVSIKNLPEDAEVEYDGIEETLAGKYLARANLVGNYTVSGPAEYEWEIVKAKYDLSQIGWSSERDFVYDGEQHGIELLGLPEELRVRYTGNEGVSAGSYRARAVFVNPDTHNFMTPDDMTMTWEIKKRTLDMSAASWDYEGPFVYDGEAKTVKLLNLPEEVRVDYENNMAFNAGTYTARAILKYDENNLEAEQPADCQWKINKRKIDVSETYWDYTSAFTYNGKEHGIFLAGLPEGLNVEYAENVKVDSGKYVASATLTPVDAHNFEVPEINGCTWAINKAGLGLGDIAWTDYKDFVYDGKEKTVEIVGDLGDAITVDYEANTAVNAGRYFSKAIFSPVDPSNFSAPGSVGYSWSIAKARHDMSAVVWDYENAFTYDGAAKSVRLLNVPDGILVSYKNETAVDAGNYTAIAQFEVQDTNNYESDIPDMMLEWSIKKAVFDMSKVKWTGKKQFAYSGEESSVKLSGLPDGLVPKYTDNAAKTAGEYTAMAEFEYDEKNYEKPEVAACHWLIERSPIDVSAVTWEYEEPFIYDGSEKSISLKNVPEGTSVQYSNSSAIQAGTYVAAAEIIPDDADNHTKSRLENLTWRIERGNYDMSHARWDYEKPFTYDGSERVVVIKGLPEGVIPNYRGNVASDAGTYKASVSFDVVDEHNFNIPEFEPLEWTIEKADYDMSGASWDYDGEFKYTGRMHEVSLRGIPEGVRAVYTGNAAADTGSYEAVADLIPYDPDNFNKPEVPSCKWHIGKADYEMSAVRWDYSDAKTYNGRPQGVLLEHLPNGVSAVYYNNEATEVGKYTAAAKLVVSDPANYNVPAVSDCDWEIVRAEYDMSGAEWDYEEGKFTYDGKRKSVKLRNLPESVNVSYTGNTASLAGNYTATAEFASEDPNFNTPASITLPWSIERADYDMKDVRWDYKDSFTFDGSPKRVELVGLPEGISVEYTENTAFDAGVYNAVARFGGDTTDFNTPADMHCTWTIEKADIDIRRLSWDYSQAFVYDGFLKKVELKGIPDLVEVTYSGNTADNAGRYEAHADLTPKFPENYNVPYVRDCNWEIVKADYDMSNARWDGDFEFLYDGTEKSVKIEGLPDGITPIYYDNRGVDAGVYHARVDLVCDTDNYNVPEMKECKWRINKASFDMSDVAWAADEKNIYDGSLKSVKLVGLPQGLSPIYEGNEAIDAGDYTATVDFQYDERNYRKPTFGSCKWHIGPAEIDVDLSQVRWNYSTPFVYDGEVKRVGIAEKQHDQGLFDRLRGRKPGVELSGIPEGFDVIYQNNIATKAGVYYASAKLVSHEESDNYNELILPQCKWEIVKAKPDMSQVRWNYDEAFVYDGEEKSVELIGLPETVSVSYTDNTGIDAGEHEAMAIIEVLDPENYDMPGPVSGCWWQIDKATYDMSQVRWTYNDDIVYNGKEKSIKVVGLPEGVKVEAYRGNKGVEAGMYTAEAILKYRNKDNFEEPSVPVQKWRIHKKKIDTSDIAWNYDDSTLFVYDDKPKEVKLIGVPKDIEVIYVDNSKINAGTYTARARLVYDSKNCEADEVPDLRWKIGKANYDTDGVHWNYERPFKYDGSEKSISLKGVPGSIAVRYRDNRAAAIGTYTAKAYLTYDSDNYEAPEIDTTIDWAIVGKDID